MDYLFNFIDTLFHSRGFTVQCSKNGKIYSATDHIIAYYAPQRLKFFFLIFLRSRLLLDHSAPYENFSKTLILAFEANSPTSQICVFFGS